MFAPMRSARGHGAPLAILAASITFRVATSPMLNPTVSQAWLLLAVAGLLEIGWAVGMKYTDGFSRPLPSVAVLVVALLSFWLLGLAMKVLPVGTAYAVWVGIGAAGAAVLGMLLFKEPATAARIVCIVLIVAGVLGLKLLHD
jgi:quaternary ammonium compound-resistance protein SugE